MTLSFKIMEEILNVVDENIHDAIEKHVKDPKKKEELHDKAFDNYVQDDVDQQDRIEKRLTGGKEGNIEAWEKAFDIKRSHDVTKNIKGEAKTDMRSGIHRMFPNVERDKDEYREQEKEYRRSKLNKSEALEIMEEIMNVVEKGVSVNLWADKAQKRIDDNPHMGVTSRGKEELERLKEIANLPRDGKSAKQVKQEASKEEAQAARKAIEADLKGNKEERDKQEGVVYKKGLIAGDNKGGCLDKWKAPKSQNINCALDIMEQICDFADNLFELDIENKQNISPNKISKVKKDKDGKDVEVVSVADELFPHDGTAKQQFDKKILDKINDMIEGTGSLEDLIQFVRKGVANKKLAHEGLSESMHKQVSKKLEKGEITSNQAMDLDKKIETKMSPEKQYQEEEEGRAEDAKTNPHSLDHYITRVATGKSIKRARKEGKISHPTPRYKDGCVFAGDPTPKRAPQTKNVVFPSRNESLDVSEDKNIFGKETGKGDLLNDIDTELGSPVKKRFNALKNKAVGCKEALDLMEDILSTINKSIHNPSKRKELTDKVKEIQGDRLASEKDVVKRGGKAATRKENGETIYTFDAPDYDRDRPKSKEKEELEMSKSYGIVPTNKERRHAEYEQAVKDADSIHRSMSKHYKKHKVDSDTRGKNWDKSIEYIEKDWKDRKEKLGN